MKKVIFLFVFFFFAAVALQAQLSQTKWKGTLQLDSPIEVVFDFGKDTVNVYTVADNSGLETMLFTAKDGMLTIKKVVGQSSCDDQITGKYKIDLNNDEMLFTLVSDDCADRANVLNKSKWIKAK